MHLTEISLFTGKRWQNELAELHTFDVYHTFQYNSLIENNVHGSYLLSFSEDKYKICFPVIIRKIENTSYNDVTSAYGYVGLLTNRLLIPDDVKENFRKLLSNYFIEKNVIAAFSRLHPLIPESEIFPKGMGVTEDVNTTVFIDLCLSPEEQLKQYSCSLRRQIIKIKNTGVRIRMGNRSEINKFASMYYDAMARLDAKAEYYFSEDYFEKMINASDFKTILLFAEYEGVEIAGGLFTCCNEFMQYHLGAVSAEFIHLSPLKVIIDEARQIGTRENMKYLHLGGGYAGQDSGLFDFKSRFSKKRAVFKVWKWVWDQFKYDELVRAHFEDAVPETSYFPLYRY